MGLTAKERMARWREKQRADPDAHARYKQKERERNKRRREEGKLKTIEDMSAREKRLTRKRWRENSKYYRQRRNVTNNLITPPTSPEHGLYENDQGAENLENNRSSSMKKRYARKRKNDKAKCYRKNKTLQIKLKFQERLTEKYKKRYNRLKHKVHGIDKYDPIQRNDKEKNKFPVKAFLLYNTMINNIRQRYKMAKTNKEKRLIVGYVTRKRILKQYGLTTFANTTLAISRRHLEQKPLRKPNIKTLRMKRKLHEYFERDDVSRITADKNATITRNGTKKQIRFLADDLKTLHAKYLSENNSMSYSLFCKLRPFWVIKPREKDRKTCMCKIHDNLNLKLHAACKDGLVQTKELNVLIKTIVCQDTSKECMYRECNECKDLKIPLAMAKETDLYKQTTWHEWKTKREQVNENENSKIVTKIVKQQEQGTRLILAKEINDEMQRACRHIFNIRNQYKALHYLRRNLTHEELIAHIDFSENYACKYAHEIQAMHFGGSRNFISLHTGVVYTKDNIIPFCTVADSPRHDPAAIWAHLEPVLNHVTTGKKYKRIHFVSDGPTTQYRNKQNFYLWTTKIQKYGFEMSTWNFLEAAHGKGPADGIGAAVKRAADQAIIVKELDITCAKDFINLIQDTTSVKLFLIPQEKICEIDEDVPENLSPLQGTMKIHQLVLEEPHSFTSRVLSCFCKHPTKLQCNCFKPDVHTVPQLKVTMSELIEKNVDVVQLNKVSVVEENLIGRYVVVQYDGLPFPGVILDVDEDEIEVKAMHRVGNNRYFWPMIDDVLWYNKEQVLTLLTDKPEHVTSRHCQIPPTMWKLVAKELNL